MQEPLCLLSLRPHGFLSSRPQGLPPMPSQLTGTSVFPLLLTNRNSLSIHVCAISWATETVCSLTCQDCGPQVLWRKPYQKQSRSLLGPKEVLGLATQSVVPGPLAAASQLVHTDPGWPHTHYIRSCRFVNPPDDSQVHQCLSSSSFRGCLLWGKKKKER